MRLMQAQLRIYRITPGQAGQFAAEWQAAVRPLREAFGFRVRGWVSEETDEFIWLLEHDDRASFERADAAYYASEARQQVSPDPARLVEDAADRWVTTAD